MRFEELFTTGWLYLMIDSDNRSGRRHLILASLLEHLKNSDSGRSLSADATQEIESSLLSLADAFTERDDAASHLSRLEERMQLAFEEIPSNVVPFRRRTGTSYIPAFSNINDRRWVLRLDCLIESPYVSEIHKMALELHLQSRRYAFIEHRDLSAESKTSVPDLLAMGAITLFVSDIMTLSPAEQLTLLDLTQQDTPTRPLLMVGSTLPYSELCGEPGLNLDLLAVLARAYIKLTRPFQEYKDQGLIHYFLDSLSENPT